MTVQKIYTTPKTYTIAVKYIDNDGQWGSVVTFTITINQVKKYYYVKDHLGNIRQTLNEAGGINVARDYYPYGETLREYNNGLANEKYEFNEKEQDIETGFLYYGARYYDGILGIWHYSKNWQGNQYAGSRNALSSNARKVSQNATKYILLVDYMVNIAKIYDGLQTGNYDQVSQSVVNGTVSTLGLIPGVSTPVLIWNGLKYLSEPDGTNGSSMNSPYPTQDATKVNITK